MELIDLFKNTTTPLTNDAIKKEVCAYPITKIVDLFDDDSISSKDWFNSIDEMLKAIKPPYTDEEVLFRYEMDITRRRFLKVRLGLNLIPLVRCTSLFILDAISLVDVSTLGEFKLLYASNSLVKKLFDKIIYTIQLLIFECVFVKGPGFILNGYTPFTYEESMAARLTTREREEYDVILSKGSPQVIKEFNLFMKNHPLVQKRAPACVVC